MKKNNNYLKLINSEVRANIEFARELRTEIKALEVRREKAIERNDDAAEAHCTRMIQQRRAELRDLEFNS
jgi:hypothetical protein